ncbi:WG repeat-containing protein [Sphingomonas sp. LB-2]|uniref:WG repeat-containing protein n=1 Tax=Sphingomonas caeni TaxID=2984949 RepID=UPI00222F2AFE|nr:WG repeat-containing protein [Sphingomonas caeni]MCW3847585.1 WG repeat-containing protein [Sphingomonas caeni]
MLAALLLLAAPVQAGGYDLECTYNSRSRRELVTAPDCARQAGMVSFNPERLRDFAFKHGLSDVNIGGHWYYVRRDGVSQPVMTFENWADEFHSNRARSEADGKIGYVDRRLRLVLPRIYDGAFPFEKGRAVVCFGCTRETDGEHSYYAGGSWACIDPSGREIRPRRTETGYKVCD